MIMVPRVNSVYFFFFQIRLDHFVPTLVLFVQQPRAERLEIMPVFGIGVQGLFYQGNLNKLQHLKGTIILETNLIHISALNNIFCSKKFRHFNLYSYMRNEKFE
jgi:hypothetical protein